MLTLLTEISFANFTKIMIFAKSFIYVITTYLFVICFALKGHGIIDFLVYLSNRNRFFLSLALGRFFVLDIAGYFQFKKENVNFDREEFIFLVIKLCTCLIILSTSIYLYPEITSNEGQLNKVGLVLLLCLLDWLNNFVALLVYRLCISKFKLTIRLCIRISVSVTLVTSMLWLWFSLIILISVLATDTDFSNESRVICLGYMIPIIKLIIVSYSSHVARTLELSHPNSRPQVSNFVCGATIALNISQMYAIFMSSNNYMDFVNQYLPHEIIKKISWFISFDPYVQHWIMRSNFKLTKKLCRSRRMVNPKAASSITEDRKEEEGKEDIIINNVEDDEVNMIINKYIPFIGIDVISREWGEQASFLLSGFAVLPISQEYLFFSTYSPLTSLIIAPPTLKDVIICLIGIAFMSDHILTIPLFMYLKFRGVDMKHGHVQFGSISVFINYVLVNLTFLLILIGAVS